MDVEGPRHTEDTIVGRSPSPKTPKVNSAPFRQHKNSLLLHQPSQGSETHINLADVTSDQEKTQEEETTRYKIGNLMTSKSMDTFILALIIIYTLIVFAYISFEEEIEDAKLSINIVELVILTLFGIEIGLKIYAFGLNWLKDGWNIFDIFIVIICFMLTIIDIVEPDLIASGFIKFSGILRLLRIVVMFRKVNEMRKMREKRKMKNRVNSLSFTSPAEQVVDILEGLLCHTWISSDQELSENLHWCVGVIQSNKLYEVEVNFGTQSDGEQAQEVVQWVQQYTKNQERRRSSEDIPLERMNRSNSFTDLIPTGFRNTLEMVDSANFNIFNLRDISENQELSTLMHYLFGHSNLFKKLPIEIAAFSKFMSEVQKGYIADNPYHNATHAADVTQTYHYMLYPGKAIQAAGLQYSDVWACYISAAIHDLGHMGRNNNFYINSKDSLAITYNDKSVLENFHIAFAYRIMNEPGADPFEKFNQEDGKTMRNKIVGMVLATDISRHFSELSKFKNAFANGFGHEDGDKQFFMEMMMHCWDISNPSKPWQFCQRWAELVLQEYFLQGDLEKELNLPVSYLWDRDTVNIPKSQVGFIDVIVKPTFDALYVCLPEISTIVETLAENRAKWEELSNIQIAEEEEVL